MSVAMHVSKVILRWLTLALPIIVLASACSFLTGDDDEEESTFEDDTVEPDDVVVNTVEPTVITGTTDAAVAIESTLTIDSALSTAGLGTVQIGHSLELAQESSGQALTLLSDASESCKIYAAPAELGNVSFMVVDDEIVRIDINTGAIKTVSGYGIGSSRTELVAAFGARIQDGPADNEVQFVPVDTADADKRVIWQLDAGELATAMRTGRIPHVIAQGIC